MGLMGEVIVVGEFKNTPLVNTHEEAQNRLSLICILYSARGGISLSAPINWH